tara:strand:+ start:9870 stop:10136 length:267 start_codon:yes stop_codon:yes gene_type:complete
VANRPQLKFLVYVPADVGGLAEHINYQVRELVRLGNPDTVLATKFFLSHKELEYPISRSLIGHLNRRTRIHKAAWNVLVDILNFFWLR